MSDTSELPEALVRFSLRMPAGHEDHIWLGPLRRFHGSEKHTPSAWRALIDRLKSQPVPRT